MKRLTTSLLLIGTLVALAAFAIDSATASSTKTATVTQTMVIVGHSLGTKGSDGLPPPRHHARCELLGAAGRQGYGHCTAHTLAYTAMV